MTTETPRPTPLAGGRVLLGAAAVALLAGLFVVAVGALAGGSGAAYGALVGSAVAVAVFLLGAGTVHVVAGVMPAASLLVALLTYTLQVAALALVLVGLDGSGLLDGALDRRWLAGALITATVAWLVAQIVFTSRARIPVYDLPPRAAGRRPEAGAP